MIKAVLFDKTYTLVYQEPNAMKRADEIVRDILIKEGNTVTVKELSSIRRKYQRLYRRGEIKDWHELAKKILTHFGSTSNIDLVAETYRDVHTSMGVLYPGVSEALKDIRAMNLMIGLVTESTAEKVEAELKRGKIKEFFDVIIVSSEVGKEKLDFVLFKEALMKLNVHPHEAVFIGDKLLDDIAPAKDLGMITIWVRQGPYSKAGLNKLKEIKPDYIVEDIRDVVPVLKRLIHGKRENCK